MPGIHSAALARAADALCLGFTQAQGKSYRSLAAMYLMQCHLTRVRVPVSRVTCHGELSLPSLSPRLA